MKKYMQMAIELAKKGKGYVSPNPLVGAIIVKEGQVIGQGYHQYFGGPHAERNAIADYKKRLESGQLDDLGKNPIEGASIYVTLEPCCHYGKTPPCTEAIIEEGISEVIVGSRDPNPKVAGKGVETLRKAGVKVIEDFCKEACDSLNKIFFHYIKEQRPFILFKYAMTADGKIATKTGKSQWVSNEESRIRVHELRSQYMGIMVGIGTVLADNPMLNVRLPERAVKQEAISLTNKEYILEEKKPRQPIRIVIDKALEIDLESKLVKTADKQRTIIVVKKDLALEGFEKEKKIKELKAKGLELIEADINNERKLDLELLLKNLAELGIDSILLEGGANLAYSFLKEDLIDEIKVFLAPKIFGGKAKSPIEGLGIEEPNQAKLLKMESVEAIGGDLLITYLPERKQKGGE